MANRCGFANNSNTNLSSPKATPRESDFSEQSESYCEHAVVIGGTTMSTIPVGTEISLDGDKGFQIVEKD